MAAKKLFKLNFVGDVMLGRLIDQMFPVHVHAPDEGRIAESFRRGNPHLESYTSTSPWGDTLGLFEEADLNLINIETSITTYPKPWPNKVFNYRMHPANVAALKAAKVDYASLANNHTLDFCVEGLVETIRVLKENEISFAGAGETAEQACASASLKLPRDSPSHRIEIFSASDHPSDWSTVPGFHLIDYNKKTRNRLKKILEVPIIPEPKPALRIFSVHWGPNYAWKPTEDIRSLAHFLIDECNIDIVHGHSSHHVQGVERYKGKLIIYGCGDFVDDYAINHTYRNDLSAIWRVVVEEPSSDRLRLRSLEVFPTKIQRFQAHLLNKSDPDHAWVRDRIQTLSADFDENIQPAVGDRGQLIFQLG